MSVTPDPHPHAPHTATFRCPRCGTVVETTWPSGEPVVQLSVQRFFHLDRPDGTTSTEPAGALDLLLCLRCESPLWPAVQLVLGRPG